MTKKTLILSPVLALLAAVLVVLPARASGLLTVGMGIDIGDGTCSLGFFGSNSQGDRLAVTAGHCANAAGEDVYNTSGDHIGQVASWLDDGGSGHSISNDDPRGFTIILIDDQWSIEPFFADAEDPDVGDPISKFGERTGKTNGTVTTLVNQNDPPAYRIMEATMVVLGGDSGSPWYYSNSRGDPVLAGMSSSSDFERDTATASSQAQTINGLYKLISNSGSRWTNGFTIWVE